VFLADGSSEYRPVIVPWREVSVASGRNAIRLSVNTACPAARGATGWMAARVRTCLTVDQVIDRLATAHDGHQALAFSALDILVFNNLDDLAALRGSIDIA